MRKLNIVLAIVIFTAISLSCSKKDDKQTSAKPEETKTDTIADKMNNLDSLSEYIHKGLAISFSKKLENHISFKKYHGKNVIVKGKFNYDKTGGFGHMGLWIGEIADISEIKLLNKLNPDDYLNTGKLINENEKYIGQTVTLAGQIIMAFEDFEIRPVNKTK